MDGRTEKGPDPALDAVVHLSGHVHGAGSIMHGRLHGKRHVNGRQGESILHRKLWRR